MTASSMLLLFDFAIAVIVLTRAHNLLIYEDQSEYIDMCIYWLNYLVGRNFGGRKGEVGDYPESPSASPIGLGAARSGDY
jgi:hypothetical protein